MSDDFQKLRRIIRGEWELLADCESSSDIPYRRLCNALRAIHTTAPPGSSDLACLLRHVLRREGEVQGGNLQRLRVPKIPPWPNRELWCSSGVQVLDESVDEF